MCKNKAKRRSNPALQFCEIFDFFRISSNNQPCKFAMSKMLQTKVAATQSQSRTYLSVCSNKWQPNEIAVKPVIFRITFICIFSS